MTTQAQKEANRRYRQRNVTNVTIGLFPDDQDILDHLNKQTSRAGYIKRLIRADIEASKKNVEQE